LRAVDFDDWIEVNGRKPMAAKLLGIDEMPFAKLGMVRVGENNGLDHAPHL
jgi:hypothetical protein